MNRQTNRAPRDVGSGLGKALSELDPTSTDQRLGDLQLRAPSVAVEDWTFRLPARLDERVKLKVTKCFDDFEFEKMCWLSQP